MFSVGQLVRDRETHVRGRVVNWMKCQTTRVFVCVGELADNEPGFVDPMWIDVDRLEMINK